MVSLAPVAIEAPIGTHTSLLLSSGEWVRRPHVNTEIDWKAFKEAVDKINKLKDERNENSCD